MRRPHVLDAHLEAHGGAYPDGSLGNASIAALRSIIPIIPGVESTLRPIVPPTSVTQAPIDGELVHALVADLQLARASSAMDTRSYCIEQAAADAERLRR